MTQTEIDSNISKDNPLRCCELQGVYETDTLLYQHIYTSIGAPNWAGYNLDALFDVLTGVIDGPIQIVWKDFQQVEAGKITMNLTMAALIEEAATEHPDLSFIKT